MGSNDRWYTLRDKYPKEAVRVALESNDRRLNAMNAFRAALADQAARLITRDESEAARAILADKVDGMAKAMNVRLESELRPVHTRLNEVGRPNWALLASLISISLVLIAGIWLVIGLKIDSSLLPVSVAVENINVADATVAETARDTAVTSITSTQAHLLNRDDRSQINGRIQVVELGGGRVRRPPCRRRENGGAIDRDRDAVQVRVGSDQYPEG